MAKMTIQMPDELLLKMSKLGSDFDRTAEKVLQAGGEVVGKMAVLAEGEAISRDDITVLAPLPLFRSDGTPIA